MLIFTPLEAHHLPQPNGDERGNRPNGHNKLAPELKQALELGQTDKKDYSRKLEGHQP